MTKAIIVEDDPRHAATLQSLLQQSTFEIEVIAVYTNIAEAFDAISNRKPELVFLDIDLECGENGFDLLLMFPSPQFSVIFTTQHTSTNNAISAIRACALDFLPKPVLRQELENALSRMNREEGPAQVKTLTDNINGANEKLKRIWLADIKGKILIEVANIIYCKSNNVWTHFFLAKPVNGRQIFISSDSIKDWEKIFATSDIMRTHNQFLLNLNFIARYLHSKGNTDFYYPMVKRYRYPEAAKKRWKAVWSSFENRPDVP